MNCKTYYSTGEGIIQNTKSAQKPIELILFCIAEAMVAVFVIKSQEVLRSMSELTLAIISIIGNFDRTKII